jgi:hypothetical protein
MKLENDVFIGSRRKTSGVFSNYSIFIDGMALEA